MPEDRIEILKRMVAASPKDSFARYGLAMEYVKAGNFEEAVGEFRELVGFDPGYCYAWFHCGQTLEKLGRTAEARKIYQQGIEAAERKGDAHARSELQGALDLLG
jgi:tetratricopeptide (TPR) repeat protein